MTANSVQNSAPNGQEMYRVFQGHFQNRQSLASSSTWHTKQHIATAAGYQESK
jgi:hypothetical protein